MPVGAIISKILQSAPKHSGRGGTSARQGGKAAQDTRTPSERNLARVASQHKKKTGDVSTQKKAQRLAKERKAQEGAGLITRRERDQALNKEAHRIMGINERK